MLNVTSMMLLTNPMRETHDWQQPSWLPKFDKILHRIICMACDCQSTADWCLYMQTWYACSYAHMFALVYLVLTCTAAWLEFQD